MLKTASMINPIELLQLNYYELARIDAEAIAQASSRLLDTAAAEGISYQGRFLSPAEARAAIATLEEPGQLAFFYELCKYPALSRFLSGDISAPIEDEALKADALSEKVAAVAAPLFQEQLQVALESGNVQTLEALGGHFGKGSPAFQQVVFQSGLGLMERKRAELEALAQRLEVEATEDQLRPLRGLQQFRQSYPSKVFNALPAYFDEEREALARAMGRMVRALSEKDTGLALAIARYARQLRMSEAYAGRLDEAIAFLQKKIDKAQAELSARSNRTWFNVAGAAVLMLILLGVGLSLQGIYNTAVEFFYEPSLFGDTSGLEGSGIEEKDLALLQEAMKDGKGLSREQMEEILRRSGNRTEVVDYDVSRLPWRERGQAADAEFSGEATLGSAPMAVCFPAKTPKGKADQQLTIVGDKVFDALVFFFNGRTFVQQAYIPAKAKYELKGKMDDQQVISTMIVFGQGWDPAVKSPCGTPGYFTENVHYSGFAGYAMDPAYPDLRSDLVAYLKKQRLAPSRELEEAAFFDLLEQYR